MKESIKVRLRQLQRITGRIFRSRLLVLRGVFCLTSSILICRCFCLQIIRGEEYADNTILEQVLEIVEGNGDSVINSFGITLDSSGNYQFSQTNETQRLRFVADVYGYSSTDDLTDEQKNQTAEDIIEYLCTDEIYGYNHCHGSQYGNGGSNHGE